MGVEILGADSKPEPAKVVKEDGASIPETGSKGKSNSEQVVEVPIQFGLVDSSHGVNGESKETGHLETSNLPKDAVDEWPAPKQTHHFYFVRFRSYEDPKLKTKIDQVDRDIQKKNQARSQLIEALRAKRSERSNLISQLKPLTAEDKEYRTAIDGKRKEMEPLHLALGQLRNVNSATREKGVGLCSSEEELDALIYSLNYRIQHESNSLVEEKKLLKEIKQLEGSRAKVKSNVAEKVKIQETHGEKEALQDRVKLIGGDMDEVRKEKQAVRGKIKLLEDELNVVIDEIRTLEEQLDAITKKREETYASLNELRKGRDEANVRFYQNRSLLNSARDLAAKKDIEALGELHFREVEAFMTEWSSSKAFRDDYERRILSSLDSRQLSRDGRMRNPDEKPIVAPQPVIEPTTVPTKATPKQTKEEALPPPVSAPKIQDEISKFTEIAPRAKPGRSDDTEETYEIGRSKELPKPDAAKLKEMKREEEIAKAKLALERKKKLAEKASAKALAKAQKDAEKKMKEKEKRAKKKAGNSEPAAPADETEETDAKTSEPEEAEVKPEAPVAAAKEKKEKMKYRGRARAPDPLPKVILKRKKAAQSQYWLWAAPAAAVLAVVVAAVVYYYYAGRI